MTFDDWLCTPQGNAVLMTARDANSFAQAQEVLRQAFEAGRATESHSASGGRRQSRGAEDIAAERSRQMTEEHWNPEHDDDHDGGDLAGAAAAYTLVAWEQAKESDGPFLPPSCWPWEPSWWKPKDPRRNLVRAGALIAAEIDRLDRAAALAPHRASGGSEPGPEAPWPL